ncbi:MAG TPA: hypothetical protein ENI94_01800 [Gammaproteobacteria bacterium]|nr:hypothetical protein [Gammaproteobacteria bacterium]
MMIRDSGDIANQTEQGEDLANATDKLALQIDIKSAWHFINQAPASASATLFDEDIYLRSRRTMHHILQRTITAH